MRSAGGRGELLSDDPQRHAFLTLTLAGFPKRDEHVQAMAEGLAFEPGPLAPAILTLALHQARRRPLLRPLLTRSLVRLAVNHPESVLEDPEARAALDHLHFALAVGTDADPRGLHLMRRAFDDMIDPPDALRPVAWDRRAELPVVGLPEGGVTMRSGVAPPPDHDAPPGDDPPSEVASTPTIAEAAADDPSYAATYYVAVATALGIDIDQVTPSACADVAGKKGQPNSVEAAWTTTTPITELAAWVNPFNWPTCSKGFFFQDMTTDPASAPTPDGPTWQADVLETVLIFGDVMTTGLHIEHDTLDGRSGPSSIYSTYDLSNTTSALSTDDLTFDAGELTLQVVFDDKTGEERTRAVCTKQYRFRDEALNEYGELACDTFWGELSIVMSTNCGNGYPPTT